MKRTRRQRERPCPTGDAGFTLVEVMIAGTLGMLLSLPAMEMLSRTYSVVAGIQARARQSQQARQILGLLGDGTSVIGTTANSRGFRVLEGLRGRRWDELPTTWTLRSASENGRFTMTQDGLTLLGDTLGPIDVTCRAAAVPIPDCTGTGTRTVRGWLGANPVLIQSGRTVSVSIAVTDPYQARRSLYEGSRVTETFRTRFTANAGRDPHQDY